MPMCRNIKYIGEKKNTKSIWSRWTKKLLALFSSLDHDEHFIDSIVDVEKIVKRINEGINLLDKDEIQSVR